MTAKRRYYSTRLQEGFVEDICVIKVEGRVTLGDSSAGFRRHIQQKISDGQRHFILDLSEVRSMDSSGLGELINAFTRVMSRTGKMVLIESPGVRDRLEIIRMQTMFESADDLPSAIAKFRGRSGESLRKVKFEDKFAISYERDKSGKSKMVVTDKISDSPGRAEYQVQDIPPEEPPKRLNPQSMILVVLVGLITLGVTIAGLVWAAKVISSIALLALIFTLALLIFILLSAVVLLLSGHLSEKTAAKLFGGVLRKLPVLSAWVPKTSSTKSDD